MHVHGPFSSLCPEASRSDVLGMNGRFQMHVANASRICDRWQAYDTKAHPMTGNTRFMHAGEEMSEVLAWMHEGRGSPRMCGPLHGHVNLY